MNIELSRGCLCTLCACLSVYMFPSIHPFVCLSIYRTIYVYDCIYRYHVIYVYVYTYIYIYVCTHTHLHIHTYVDMHHDKCWLISSYSVRVRVVCVSSVYDYECLLACLHMHDITLLCLHAHACEHMAPFQFGSFLSGFASNWAQL